MTTTTAQAELDALAAAVGVRVDARGELRMRCPSHGGRSTTSLAARAGDKRVLIRCHAGCSYDEIAEALDVMFPAWRPAPRRPAPVRRGTTYVRHRVKIRTKNPDTVSPFSAGSPAPTTDPPAQEHPPAGAQKPSQRIAHAVEQWRRAGPIPADSAHPVRRWAARRRLWRPGHPWPSAMRWLGLPTSPTCAGLLLCLLAWPDAWAGAWPGLPYIQAVQSIALDAEGRPGLDRPADKGGVPKRTLGLAKDAVLLIGNPDPLDVWGPARICEGAADALALAARATGAVWASMTTPEKVHDSLLAMLPAGVIIHADDDDAGRAGALALLTRCHAAGVQADAFRPLAGKDAADTAASLAWRAVDEQAAREYVATWAEYEWPRWEIIRQAGLATEIHAGGET